MVGLFDESIARRKTDSKIWQPRTLLANCAISCYRDVGTFVAIAMFGSAYQLHFTQPMTAAQHSRTNYLLVQHSGGTVFLKRKSSKDRAWHGALRFSTERETQSTETHSWHDFPNLSSSYCKLEPISLPQQQYMPFKKLGLFLLLYQYLVLHSSAWTFWWLQKFYSHQITPWSWGDCPCRFET